MLAESESRETVRQNIQLEEVNGSFRLSSRNKNYDPAVVRDVSVSGAGIQLPEPLEVGATVDLTFAAGDWRISVEGRVVWCSIANVKRGDAGMVEAYRMGIKFNPRNANNNVIFFMASRSMVNPHI
jgi:hypothetical protein